MSDLLLRLISGALPISFFYDIRLSKGFLQSSAARQSSEDFWKETEQTKGVIWA
jgi:hypothetical protein